MDRTVLSFLFPRVVQAVLVGTFGLSAVVGGLDPGPGAPDAQGRTRAALREAPVIGSVFRATIDARFAERLMLAVIEVNGCDACCYAHIRTALTKGFTKGEIESFLSATAAFSTRSVCSSWACRCLPLRTCTPS
ncbi:MAG: carboxymuconolactone decarboxylase family protein [Spirochaetales bacterium]|nr:carboxymuconolactone decarboxylase family protein [Spirochaetales bacterium]